MTEDEIYRTTTQYRLWSFTAESLASIRHETNSLAAERVRRALRQRTGSHVPDDSDQDEAAATIECLTVEEEQKLINFYCVKAMALCDFCEFPTNIKVGCLSMISIQVLG